MSDMSDMSDMAMEGLDEDPLRDEPFPQEIESNPFPDILDPGPLQCEQSRMRENEIKIEDFDKKYRVRHHSKFELALKIDSLYLNRLMKTTS